MAPVNGIGVVTEVVVGELLQPGQLGMDGGGVGEVGVEGGWLGVHRGLCDVIDDTPMNALFDQEAKLFPMHFVSESYPRQARLDRLQPLRLTPILCYPTNFCWNVSMTEPWVSVEQIAEHLGVTRDSIYRWIDRKALPAHRVGRLWKFKVSEVDGWVRAGGADEGAEASRMKNEND